MGMGVTNGVPHGRAAHRRSEVRSEVRSGRGRSLLGFAAISGARTFLGPALAARRAGAGRKVRLTVTLLAAWELLFDKIPGIRRCWGGRSPVRWSGSPDIDLAVVAAGVVRPWGPR